MASFSAKIFDVFRNLKSDAVPRNPRPEANNTASANDSRENEENHNNEHDTSDEVEDISMEQDKEKPKLKRNGFERNKKQSRDKTNKGSNKSYVPGNNVNTQATGYVINIIDSNNVRCGNNFVYHLGPTNTKSQQEAKANDSDEDVVEKTNLISLLMEADITPEHKHIDYISKNLGRKWHSFFKRLGYTMGRIETFEIDEGRHGVSEARYKLLLDWVRNDDIGTLGHLATQLWEEGERQIVKELSLIYSNNKH